MDALTKAFLEWANRKGYDTAHAYNQNESRWIFLSPMTADVYEAWQAAQSVPVLGPPVAWVNINKQGDITRTVSRRDNWCTTPVYRKPTNSIPAADLARLREKAAEADALRECKALLSEARKSMRQYEADCDEYPPFHHNKLMERIDAAIAQEGE